MCHSPACSPQSSLLSGPSRVAQADGQPGPATHDIPPELYQICGCCNANRKLRGKEGRRDVDAQCLSPSACRWRRCCYHPARQRFACALYLPSHQWKPRRLLPWALQRLLPCRPALGPAPTAYASSRSAVLHWQPLPQPLFQPTRQRRASGVKFQVVCPTDAA